MDFKDKRLMMSKEEVINRAKELLNENQEVLITKYMFLEQQCKKQKEVIYKVIQLLEDDNICADIRRMKPKWNENKYGVEYELLDILKEVSE